MKQLMTKTGGGASSASVSVWWLAVIVSRLLFILERNNVCRRIAFISRSDDEGQASLLAASLLPLFSSQCTHCAPYPILCLSASIQQLDSHQSSAEPHQEVLLRPLLTTNNIKHKHYTTLVALWKSLKAQSFSNFYCWTQFASSSFYLNLLFLIPEPPCPSQ